MSAEKTFQSSTRADLVRQRRTQRSTQRVTQTRSAASRTPRNQPVTFRSEAVSAGRPILQNTRSRVKRQYYYSLGASGAEIRLPAIPMVNLGTRVISAIIAVFCMLAIYALGLSAEFQVSDVSIEGISRLTPADVEAVLDARGTQIVAFDAQAAREALELAFPELTNVHIQVGFPAKISLKVTELQPAISWNIGDTSYWIDATGVILPPRGEAGTLLTIGSNTEPPLLPLAESVSTSVVGTAELSDEAAPVEIWGRKVDTQTLKRIIDLQSLIPPDSKLVYNSENGLGWENPSGLDVYIGRDLSDFDLKLSMYNAIIASLEQQGITPQDMISVEFINAPFYR